MKKPPTLTQREHTILKALQDGKEASYHPYQGRFNPHEYYRVDCIGQCTREMKKLIKLGLVSHVPKRMNGWADIKITDAGRTFTCEIKPPDDIWVAESNYMMRVSLLPGYLTGSTLVTSKGASIRANDHTSFFSTRKEAFDHLVALQEKAVCCAEGRVRMENEKLKELVDERDKTL